MVNDIEMQEYLLCSCDKGGICRNFKNIITGMRMADYYKLKLVIYWPLVLKVMQKQEKAVQVTYNNIKNIPFLDIFDGIDFNYVLVESKNELSNYKIKKKICTWQFDLLPNEIKSLPNNFSELWLTNSNNSQITAYEYNNVPINIRNNIVSYIEKVKFNKKLIERVNSFCEAKFKPDHNIIGVTVRTWPEHLERRRWYNIQHYIDVLDKIVNDNPNSQLFVCADDNQPIVELTKKYGDRIVINDIIKRERGGTYNININDIMDLLILMRCHYVVGCLTSNWCETVWYFTKCQIKYETINEILDDKCYEAVRQGRLKKYNFIIDN